VTRPPAGVTRVSVGEAYWPDDRAVVEELFREYVAALGVDVSFQNVEEEFASLPGRYACPLGCVLLARGGHESVGAVAWRTLEPGLCEMKRLYVRPRFRGRGIARKLTEAVIADARDAGYRTIVLDTLVSMQAARALYASLGFRPVPAYYDNPLPDVVYLELDLRRCGA
jgi:ribosomal protein S18 acetylase RimI-like enzyme